MARSLLRRDSARYSTVENRAVVAWWEKGESSQATVQVENISQSGALLTVEQKLPLPAEVWLRLEAPKPTEWVHAQVVGNTPGRSRGILWLRKTTYHIRLKFTSGCPFEFYKAATHGESLNEEFREPTSPEFDSRTWR
jgi:hypothetical protein